VDDGEKIDPAQSIAFDGFDQKIGAFRRMASIEIVEIDAPFEQLGLALLARTDAVVGDVVDETAESVDGEHRLTLCLRHQAHRRVERAGGRLLLGGLDDGDVLRWSEGHGLAAESVRVFLGRSRAEANSRRLRNSKAG